MFRSSLLLRGNCVFALLLLLGPASFGHPAVKPTRPAAQSSAEARAAKAYEDARKEGPLALRAFLYGMPKGADLHSHLSGAIYAETWIRDAGEDHLCVDTKTLAFVKPDAGQYTGTDEQGKHFAPICKAGQ